MQTALRALSVAILIVVFSSGASAFEPLHLGYPTSGYSYFNRPGASLADHNADIASCFTSAGQLVNGMAARNPDAGLVGALIIGGPAQTTLRAGIENCMVVHGWRVVRTAKEQGALLAKLATAEIASRLTPWIGAASPPGDIVRVFRNDAARGSTSRFDSSLFSAENTSLSRLAAGDVKAASTPDVYKKPKIDKRWPKDKLAPKNFAKAPAGSAIVIFETKGITLTSGNGIHFGRIAADGAAHPGATDGAPEDLSAETTVWTNNSKGNWYAFAVPPGRWRLSTLGGGTVALSLCLGSPGFEVAAGEVVYAGAFDMTAEDIGPDMALAPVQQWLAGQPAAATVKAAAYSNGWTSVCAGQYMYALEIPGAPFREGYTWGGAYVPAAATGAVAAGASTP